MGLIPQCDVTGQVRNVKMYDVAVYTVTSDIEDAEVVGERVFSKRVHLSPVGLERAKRFFERATTARSRKGRVKSVDQPEEPADASPGS